MIPDLILDMRDETFTTQKELDELIHEKLAEARIDVPGCVLRQVVITPHQEKLLKLELAEQFVFRWKNLKGKSLGYIGNVPVVKADPEVSLCPGCGSQHDLLD